MEQAKCKKNAILDKELEIKSIIDDFREFIEACASNYNEKTVYTLKRHLTRQKNIFCDEEDHDIEDLKICIESLNSLKNKYFRENQYQSKSIRHNDLISDTIRSTFIKTLEWLALKRSLLNPNNNDNKCFQYSVILSLYLLILDTIRSTFIKIPEWLALKRSLLNPNNNDNKCFQYSVILSLYHEQLGRNFSRISGIKKYANNFNWKNINFPPQE